MAVDSLDHSKMKSADQKVLSIRLFSLPNIA